MCHNANHHYVSLISARLCSATISTTTDIIKACVQGLSGSPYFCVISEQKKELLGVRFGRENVINTHPNHVVTQGPVAMGNNILSESYKQLVCINYH